MKKLKITETSLRDGHQSLIATRLKTNEIIPILETMDQVGYYAMEVWGGATFDACIRFLDEDPWERLRLIRKHVKNTKLQMLLRGQNLLGYRNYADDTVEKFIELSIKNGIDIIRVFDALNDVRNLEASIKAIKKYNGHCQCAISYTTSPIHTPEYYLELIKTMESMGADSICIKDMAGVLTPYKAYDLVKRIKEMTDIPIDLHTHCTGGIADMIYMKAVEAGVDAIVISNHGGRVLDCTPGVCEVIPSIAKAVKGKITILADGGVRTGVDVVKMIGLGADAVLIGRPFVTASFGGKTDGVKTYVENIKNELKSTMILTGCQSIKDIDSKVIYNY